MSTKTLADKIRELGARMFLSSKPISYADEVQPLVELCAEMAEALDTIDRLFWDPHAMKDLSSEVLAKARALVGGGER